jgi:uncharacterized membrane protein
MLTTQSVLLFLSVLLSALIMGLLYGYACSVNPGLHKLTDAEYLKAMQSINKEIQNPVFFISFMGTLVVLPVAAWYSKTHATSTCFYFLVAATLIYMAGVVGITAFGNIPLNNALAKFNIQAATAADISKQRLLFEASWNRYHLIRTLFSIVATACTIIAVIKNGSAD